MLIGLGYKAESGKDTIAEFLDKRCDFSRVAFADALKEAVAAIFGFNKKQLYEAKAKKTVDEFWGVTPREVLQKVGTECLRRHYAEDIWIRALRKRVRARMLQGKDIVVTDVRFPNEAEAIKNWGGVLVRVDRPGHNTDVGGIEKHASETSLDGYTGWDHIIVNDGTLGDLEDRTIELATKLGVYSARPDPQLELPLG